MCTPHRMQGAKVQDTICYIYIIRLSVVNGIDNSTVPLAANIVVSIATAHHPKRTGIRTEHIHPHFHPHTIK